MKAPGVGCGAAILRDGKLLLVKRLKAPESGCWNLPGGKVDFGERIEAAVAREILEEIGVAIEVMRPLGMTQMIDIDDQHWISPIYLARIVSGEPRNVEPQKHEAVVWADLVAPPQPLALAAREAIALLLEGER